uniref:SPX domain-containing protein n=1 Tax=Daucus carota subsp. sativus TaxID=79200 RepID=A0A164SVV9_DAUCS
MKFGKELKSQMVPEWQDAYMDYGFLKTLLKDIQHFRHKTMPPPAHPPGLPRALTHYRAFSGLTSLKRSISMRSASGRQHHHEDLESQAILVNNVKKTNGEVGYQTTFLRASEDGGEYELVYFKRLDDEFNKVNMFYRAKVDEVMKEADELNRQMNALIAFRIKVENPKHAWFDTSENMDHLVSAVESSNKELSASISSFGRRHSKRVAEHMDQIDEDKSVKMTRSKSSTSSDRYSKEAKQLINQVVPEVTITGRPASLDILNRVTINRPADTPLPTIKGVLNVPVQTDMKFSSENLSKIEEQLKRAFTEFYHKLRLLKSYSILQDHEKIRQGFFAGCTVALVFAVILTIRTRNLFEKEGADRYMETMFPLYSLYGFIVLHMLFYAGNIYFWKKYKINYQFIFGFKAGTELGYREVLLVSFALSVLALASIHGNLDMEMDPKTKDYKQLTELVPLILLILAFAVLICPFNIIYRSSRYFFLTCAVHVFLAPLYKVVLSDFFVGDQLTSQVQAFRSIEFYFCYYSSGDFKYREHNCNKNDAYNTFSYILAAIPFWWRMLQVLIQHAQL